MRHADRLVEITQGVLDDELVVRAAEQEADRRLVIGVAEEIVGRREVEVELADERGIERDRLELDDDEAAKLQVIEEEVEVKVLVADLEVDLAADEGEAGAELEHEALEVVDERLLDLALAARIGSAVPRKSNR